MPHRLRKHHPEKALRRREPQGSGGARLTGRHRFDAVAENLSRVSGKVDREADHADLQGRHALAGEDYIIKNHQENGDRDSLDHPDIDPCKGLRKMAAAHFHPADQRAEQRSDDSGEQGKNQRYAQSVQEHLPALFPDKIAEETVADPAEKL